MKALKVLRPYEALKGLIRPLMALIRPLRALALEGLTRPLRTF